MTVGIRPPSAEQTTVKWRPCECVPYFMEPMLTIPATSPGAGGYREHDILVVTAQGAENITGFPYGPEHNILA